MVTRPAERTAGQLLEWLLEVRAVRRFESTVTTDGMLVFVVTLPDGCRVDLTEGGVVAFHRGVLVGWRLPRVAS